MSQVRCHSPPGGLGRSAADCMQGVSERLCHRGPAFPRCTMKRLLCGLLLLSLCPGRTSGSCHRACLSCREKLGPALDSFSLEVCVLQCEARASPAPLWTPCTEATAGDSWQLDPTGSEQVGGAPETQQLKRMPRVRSLGQEQERPEPGPQDVQQKRLQKRFGGFTGARKSARKLANQKRFSEFMRQYLVLSMQSSQRRRTWRQKAHA
ncbi:LOW QUALITY PROTEIN: prepronociceptin [Sorex araneus]|uniref:LOW QUALITY PROTEIN: prepronociceptin n=1 Tax=Sorex araneus TaxID=42254 RepID=UPI002434001B|nr:LOW QUALITY PROTEIN: prepronociceptin [Sorex araneus]